MKKRQRTVGFYEISVQTTAAAKVNFEPTQSEFLELFEKIAPLIKKKTTYGTARSPVELVDFKHDEKNNQLFLLFNKVNPDLPEIGLYKKTTKARRTPTKDADEEREQSAHVLITPMRNTSKARVLITGGAGISPNYVQKVFSELYKKNKDTDDLKKIRNRRWPTRTVDNNGNTKHYLVNHTFQITGEPSESLSNILKNQDIFEIDMIDNRDLTIDGTSLKVDKRTFTLSGRAIPKSVPGLRGAIQKAMDQFNIEVDHLRIVYEEDEDTEITSAAGINDQGSDMHVDTQKKIKKTKSLSYAQLDQLFTRNDKIILANDHAETQTVLSTDICDKLLKL